MPQTPRALAARCRATSCMWGRLNKKIRALIAAAFWLLLWELLALIVGNSLLLPGPWDTAMELVKLMPAGTFWRTVATTMGRIALGYSLGVAVGTALGALCAKSAFADDIVSPVMRVIRATPVTSFILLVLLYFSSGITPVVIAFLMVTPMLFATVRAHKADAELVEMAKFFGIKGLKLVRRVYAPLLKPQFLAQAATALGFAWKSGVAAEVIARSAYSIGKSIYESKLYVETPSLFAWTAVTVALSIGLERLLSALARRI